MEIDGSYEVVYSYSQGTSQVNRTSQISVVLENLAESELYSIEVRGVTAAGPGPYSDPVLVMTIEQGI